MAKAQLLPCPPPNNTNTSAGPDQTICPGTCAQLAASAYGVFPPSTLTYRVDSLPYIPYPYNQGTLLPALVDDTYGPVINLPFSFCFFGIKYNQCVIGANGELGFNIGQANGGITWSLNGITAPANQSGMNNSIMGPYHDLLLTSGGNIRYETYGVAPCRAFVVSWENAAYFNTASCPGVTATHQIVIYESTNQIVVNIQSKPICTGWNNGLAILGIQNASATLAYTAPGKNGTQWTANNQSYTFIPDGTGSAPTVSYEWYDMNNTLIATTDTVTVCPADTAAYYVKARLISGCDTFYSTDTVVVNVKKAITADFTYDIQYGCSEDTVLFTNTSTGAVLWSHWDFGDGTSDTATSPTHIYTSQGSYNAKLIISDGSCKDSITKTIDTQHPLLSSFTVDDDSVCQGATINFTNTSTYTQLEGPAEFYWDFGDGQSATGLNAFHTYPWSGVYTVRLVVKDFVPCYDTSYHTVIVDSAGTISFTISDSVLCEGQGIIFNASYTDIGLTRTIWDFGDGNFMLNQDNILHAYDSAGNYTVTLTGQYRICPDLNFSKDITIRSFPTMDLGNDTTMCPNGEPIVIGDYKNAGSGASWLWNTGETTPFIAVRHPGLYTASIRMNGCETSDSIQVFKDCYIDIPNSFTPDGDGMNDYFLPRQLLSKGVTGFKMTIYNRWGQEIYETTQIDGRGWDGKYNSKDQPMGVYVYIIDAVIKGTSKEHYEGNVTLLR